MVAAIAGKASWSVPIGAPVYDVTGEKLGTVAGTDGFDLLVEHGLLFVTTHAVPMGLVARYDDGGLHLRVTKAELLGAGEDAGSRRADPTDRH
jgi:hypothetical protein